MFFALERIRKTLDELERHIYSILFTIDSFQMKEGNFSSPDEADRASSAWKNYITGQGWGGEGEYAWIKAEIKVPEAMHDSALALEFHTCRDAWDEANPQFILYINGEVVQGLDRFHSTVVLKEPAVRGSHFQIDLHAYSGRKGHKADLSMTFAALNVHIEKLWYDISVPLQIAELLPVDDKNRIDITKVLNAAVNLLDLRKPGSKEFHESVKQCLNFLSAEFYEKICGSEDVTATCVGHTHIDVAYLWTLAQTRQKTVRSFSTVLKLMDDYPEYLFMSSQPQLYKFLKEDHPEVYDKVKERIKEGRWEAEGAMWVEADCNLTSGESLVRQILFGTRFFEKEFGVKNEILWLPDVFGYSGALPQILKKSGIKYFMTTKISWNQFNKMPYDTFLWKGIDGTEILTHFITTQDFQKEDNAFRTTYNGILNPSQVMGAWQRYQQKHINNNVLIAYGYGDGGGGPDIRMLENAKRLAKGIPGCPRVKMGTAGEYFRMLEKTVAGNPYLPKWVGEIFLEYHQGTYTSMAKNKRFNRKSELLYQDIEFFSSFNKTLGGEYPQERINQGWEKILLNQFHDILPGSSIYEVYEDSHRQYEEIFANGRALQEAALNFLLEKIHLKERSLVVFNTLSFSRNDLVEVELPSNMMNPEILDEKDSPVPCQPAGNGKVLVYVKDIPAKGYRSFKIRESGGSKSSGNCKHCEIETADLTVTKQEMENRFFKIILDQKGTILSILDKRNNRQIISENERGNKILAFEDRPLKYDNWNIDIYYQEKMWEVDDVENAEVIENGPVRGCLRIRRRFLDSVITQDMIIYNDIPRIDFKTRIDWNEDQILLKADFPVDVHADKAVYEIQFGNVERPAHQNTSWDTARYEVCGQKWADLSEDGYGVSLLNDCKYGYDIRDGHMRLTLLKSGIYPNPKADRGLHEFVYSLYPHGGDWKEGGTVQMSHCLNVPLYGLISGKNHKGMLPKDASLVSINCENVVLDTIKKAEDSDALVIRMYECYNRRSNVNVTFLKELAEVTECNLMETPLKQVPFYGNVFSFEIRPYEIKTFLLKPKNKA
ncbi:MAG: alpha-mannosidase [Caldicoprobacterales bacterium]|jgi:alpha-mannosidase